MVSPLSPPFPTLMIATGLLPPSLPPPPYLYVWVYGWFILSHDVQFECNILSEWVNPIVFGWRNAWVASSVRCFDVDHLICVHIVHFGCTPIFKKVCPINCWPKMLLTAQNNWYVHVDPLMQLRTSWTWKILEVLRTYCKFFWCV